MELTDTVWIAVITVFVYMTIMFVLAMWLKDNSIADTAWGIGFIVVTVAILIVSGDYSARQILATSLVVVWGLRLAIRILRRNWGKGEDFRYRKWRDDWGRYFVVRSYAQVFLLQGFLLFLIAFPVLIINTYAGRGLFWLDAIGALIWLVGFLSESIHPTGVGSWIWAYGGTAGTRTTLAR